MSIALCKAATNVLISGDLTDALTDAFIYNIVGLLIIDLLSDPMLGVVRFLILSLLDLTFRVLTCYIAVFGDLVLPCAF